MLEPTQLDCTFDFIMGTFIDRGHAPHYTEIAKKFGVPPEAGKKLLQELINTRIMSMRLHPGTDLVASFAPCLDCGESLSIQVRDGVIENRTPPGIVGYTNTPFRKWSQNWAST